MPEPRRNTSAQAAVSSAAPEDPGFRGKRTSSLKEQMDLAKPVSDARYPEMTIPTSPYFQSYTNTYAPLPYLEQLFTEAVSFRRSAVFPSGQDRTVCRMGR